MIEVNEHNFNDMIKSSDLCIVLFKAKNCAPCIAVAHKLEAFHKQHPNINIYMVDSEKEIRLAAAYNIFSASSVLVFVKGKLMIKEVGYYSVEKLFDRVLRYEALLYK